MTTRRRFMIRSTTAALSAVAGRSSLFGQAAPLRLVGSTAITRVYGEGQKLVAVALEYSRSIDGKDLTEATYRVKDRTVTAAYASLSANVGSKAKQGRFVIVELSPEDPGALLLLSPQGGGRGAPGGPPGGPPKEDGSGRSPRETGGQAGSPRRFPSPTLLRAEATVTQAGVLVAADGAKLQPGEGSFVTKSVKNLIVDEFKQLTYTAPDGGTLAYNLFVPKNYDPKRSYPLVLFVHDAGTLSANPLVTLAQGLGAVVWASPEDQAKRECFVVAPQFSNVAEGEKSGAGSSMDLVHGLLGALIKQYNIDTQRLYSTGQSMGAMLSIAMNIAYPRFFAASFLVAGQWDAQQAAPLAKDKLWIVVSQGDERAYPGENAMVAIWEREGAHISRAVWNGRSDAAEFAADVKAMEAKGDPIHYVALQKGTVVPASQQDNPISNHLNTWRIAYSIEGIRAWLFEQRL